MSRRHTARRRVSAIAVIGGWVRMILLAIIVVVLLRFFVVDLGVVDGDSMLPTLINGEYVMVNRIVYALYTPERGDIVTCYFPYRARAYVKRVVGLPGDVLRITNGQLYVNDEILEPVSGLDPSLVDMEPYTVPPESVFVMGDNRNHSLDSRNASVGCINMRDVVGKAFAVVYPLDEIHTIR